MFKTVLIYFLVACTISNCYMQLIVYSGYEMNKAYISSVFCVNKTHPEKHCDGQCFLAKKLKDLAGKTKQDQETLKRIAEVEPQLQILELNHKQHFIVIAAASGYLEKAVVSSSISIFHPPKLV